MPRPGKTRSAGGGLDLGSHIATKVAILANRLQRAASRYYRARYGIGVVEWRLIMFIGRATQTRANHICKETELDKGAVSRSLSVLESMGIVSVEGDGADGRRNNILLTEKGRALHDELVPVALDRQSELVAALSQAEIEILIGLIDRLLLKVKVADGDPRLDEPASARTRKRVSRQSKSPSGRRKTTQKK